MNINLDDEQAHQIEVAVHTLIGLLEIANEKDDEPMAMSMEGAQKWAYEQLINDFSGGVVVGATSMSSDERWWLSYQLGGSLPYMDNSLRSENELRPVIAHLSESTPGPEIGAEVWCIYWVDEIGVNDWIEWFDTHTEAAYYLGRLVAAAFTGEHIDTINIERV